jgi:hypothetical protein
VNKKTLISVLVPFSVLLANVTNLVTQLLLPRYMVVSEYSVFATLWSYGQLAAVIVFEWMRFCVVRFSEGADQSLAQRRRSTLFLTYVAGVLFFLLLIVVGVALSALGEWGWWLVAVSIYAVGQGSFDGRQALARARFNNGSFAAAWIFRSVAGLALALLLAVEVGNGPLVLAGLGGAFFLAALIFGIRELPALRSVSVDSSELRFLAKYGAFVAVSSSITAALPALVRSMIINAVEIQNTGGSILALDLSQKALAVIGMVINVTILQKSIRTAEFGSEEQKSQQMARHVGMTAAFIMPAAVLFYEIQPLLATYLVPANYMASYMTCVATATVGATLLCLRQFSVDALFVVAGKSTLSVVGPATAVVVTLLSAWCLKGLPWSPELLMCASMALGLLAAAAVAIYAVGRVVSITWPMRDFLGAAVACAVISFVMRIVTSRTDSLLIFVFGVATAILAYVIVAWFVNLCGFRSFLKQKLSKRT